MTSAIPATSSALASALARSINFELTLADGVRRSERRAWIVATCAMGMSLICLKAHGCQMADPRIEALHPCRV